MRAGYSMALAALALPFPAMAAAAGEAIELHIENRTAIEADSTEFTVSLSGWGKTGTEALASLEAKHQALLGKLAAAGISPATATYTIVPAPEEQPDPAMGAAHAACEAGVRASRRASAASRTRSAPAAQAMPLLLLTDAPCDHGSVARNAVLVLTFTDLAKLPRVLAITNRANADLGVVTPLSGFRTFAHDPLAARKAALAKAFADARSEADAYAAAIGRHVVGISRIGNGKLGDPVFAKVGSFVDAIAAEAPARQGEFLPPGPGTVTVTVDYLIAPN